MLISRYKFYSAIKYFHCIQQFSAIFKNKPNKQLSKKKRLQIQNILMTKTQFGLQQPYKLMLQHHSLKSQVEDAPFEFYYQKYCKIPKQYIQIQFKFTYFKLYAKLFNHIKLNNILDIKFRQIKNFVKYQKQQIEILQSFINDIVLCLYNTIRYYDTIQRKLSQNQMLEYIRIVKKLKPYIYLIQDSSIGILTNLINLYSNIKKVGFDIYSTQRNTITIILEKIMNNQNIPIRQIKVYLYFAARYGVFNMSTQLQIKFWKFTLEKLPEDWPKLGNLVFGMFYSLGKQGIINKSIKNEFLNCLQNQYYLTNDLIRDQDIKNLIVGSLRLKILNKDNIKKYQHVIKLVTKQSLSFRSLAQITLNFLKARIWHRDIWLHFFQKIPLNHKILNDYDVVLLFFAIKIFADQIPKQILEASQKVLKQNKQLKQRAFIYMEPQRMTLFNKQNDESLFKQKNFYQLSLQNYFVCGGLQYQIQKLIHFMRVDAYLPKYNTIIEVNGPTHYIYDMDTDKQEVNNNTFFKEQILRKLGYKVLSIKLNDYYNRPAHPVDFIQKLQKQKNEII